MKTPPTRGSTLAELVSKYYRATNPLTRWSLRQIIDKRVLRGEAGRTE